ncbi:hypothetical protein ACA910_004667 [Epithemia clementina (nom. ined.)]
MKQDPNMNKKNSDIKYFSHNDDEEPIHPSPTSAASSMDFFRGFTTTTSTTNSPSSLTHYSASMFHQLQPFRPVESQPATTTKSSNKASSSSPAGTLNEQSSLLVQLQKSKSQNSRVSFNLSEPNQKEVERKRTLSCHPQPPQNHNNNNHVPWQCIRPVTLGPNNNNTFTTNATITANNDNTNKKHPALRQTNKTSKTTRTTTTQTTQTKAPAYSSSLASRKRAAVVKQRRLARTKAKGKKSAASPASTEPSQDWAFLTLAAGAATGAAVATATTSPRAMSNKTFDKTTKPSVPPPTTKPHPRPKSKAQSVPEDDGHSPLDWALFSPSSSHAVTGTRSPPQGGKDRKERDGPFSRPRGGRSNNTKVKETSALDNKQPLDSSWPSLDSAAFSKTSFSFAGGSSSSETNQETVKMTKNKKTTSLKSKPLEKNSHKSKQSKKTERNNEQSKTSSKSRSNGRKSNEATTAPESTTYYNDLAKVILPLSAVTATTAAAAAPVGRTNSFRRTPSRRGSGFWNRASQGTDDSSSDYTNEDNDAFISHASAETDAQILEYWFGTGGDRGTYDQDDDDDDDLSVFFSSLDPSQSLRRLSSPY